MSRYSSDSDSSSGDSRRNKNKATKSKGRYRSSSSTNSDDSNYSYQKKSSKHKHSHRKTHSRSSSTTRHGKSKHSRQRSRIADSVRSRSSSKSRSGKASRDKHRSRSRDRHRSPSRDTSRRRSKSRSRSRERTRVRSKSSSPESRSSDSRTQPAGHRKQEPSTQEQLRAKLRKAIKAAQTADDQLRQQGLLPVGSTTRKDEIVEPTIPEPLSCVLDEINDSSFIPKQFSSTKSAPRVLSDMPIPTVDITCDLPMTPINLEEPGSLFHSSLFVDPKIKLEKWVKKLFHLRQKAINGEPIVIVL